MKTLLMDIKASGCGPGDVSHDAASAKPPSEAVNVATHRSDGEGHGDCSVTRGTVSGAGGDGVNITCISTKTTDKRADVSILNESASPGTTLDERSVGPEAISAEGKRKHNQVPVGRQREGKRRRKQ